MPAPESKIGDLLQNETEARIVSQIVRVFVDAGIEQDQIGIVSFYRQQVKLLSSTLHAYERIEILTADRSQGRDKDCIIVSLVRCNDTKEVRPTENSLHQTYLMLFNSRLVIFSRIGVGSTSPSLGLRKSSLSSAQERPSTVPRFSEIFSQLWGNMSGFSVCLHHPVI